MAINLRIAILACVVALWNPNQLFLSAQVNPRKAQFNREWAEVDLYLKHGKIDLVMEKIMVIDAKDWETEFASKVFDVVDHYRSLATAEFRRHLKKEWQHEKIFDFTPKKKEGFLGSLRFVNTDDLYEYPYPVKDSDPQHAIVRAKCLHGGETPPSINFSREAPSLLYRYQAVFVLDADQNPRHSMKAHHSLLIADGDSNIHKSSGAIVIVRGCFPECTQCERSMIFCNGWLKDEKTIQEIQRNDDYYKTNHINMNSTKTLRWLNWFETSEIGIVVEQKEDKLLITKLEAECDFAKAKLKVGDEVSRIDGKTPLQPDEFRRLIRAALVRGKIEMRIVRDKEVVNAKFDLQPWKPPVEKK